MSTSYKIGDKVEIVYGGTNFLTTIVIIEPYQIYLTIDGNNDPNTNTTYLAWSQPYSNNISSNNGYWMLPNGVTPTSIKVIKQEIEPFPFEQLPIFPQLDILVQSDIYTFPQICKSSKLYNDICNGKPIDGHGDLSHYLYEARSKRWFDDKLLKYKEETMTWKEFYDRVIQFLLAKKKAKEKASIFVDQNQYLVDLVSTFSYHGKLMEVKMIVEPNPKIVEDRDMSRILTNAAGNGKLEILKYFYDNFGLLPGEDAMKYAITYGHMDVINWLEEHGILFSKNNFDNERIYFIIESTTPEVLIWLLRKGITISNSYISAAAHSGNLPVFKFFAENGAAIGQEIISTVIYNGHLNILEYVFSFKPELFTNRQLAVATERGHTKIVKWFYENMRIVPETQDVEHATNNGNFELLKYLHSIGYRFSDDIINYAINSFKNNNEMILWLLSLGYQITSLSLNFALRNDNLEIAKLLYSKGAKPNEETYESGKYSSSKPEEILGWLASIDITENTYDDNNDNYDDDE